MAKKIWMLIGIVVCLGIWGVQRWWFGSVGRGGDWFELRDQLLNFPSGSFAVEGGMRAYDAGNLELNIVLNGTQDTKNWQMQWELSGTKQGEGVADDGILQAQGDWQQEGKMSYLSPEYLSRNLGTGNVVNPFWLQVLSGMQGQNFAFSLDGYEEWQQLRQELLAWNGKDDLHLRIAGVDFSVWLKNGELIFLPLQANILAKITGKLEKDTISFAVERNKRSGNIVFQKSKEGGNLTFDFVDVLHPDRFISGVFAFSFQEEKITLHSFEKPYTSLQSYLKQLDTGF